MSKIKPYFELHIRPMFRMIDRDKMKGALDLWSYDSVKERAEDIARHLRPNVNDPGVAIMPPVDWGGPWPDGWIEVFETWRASGCPKLGSTIGTYALTSLADGTQSLVVKVLLANGADSAWLDRQPAGSGSDELVLYHRPSPDGATEPSRTVVLPIKIAAGVTEVYLTDAAGRHRLSAVS